MLCSHDLLSPEIFYLILQSVRSLFEVRKAVILAIKVGAKVCKRREEKYFCTVKRFCLYSSESLRILRSRPVFHFNRFLAVSYHRLNSFCTEHGRFLFFVLTCTVCKHVIKTATETTETHTSRRECTVSFG